MLVASDDVLTEEQEEKWDAIAKGISEVSLEKYQDLIFRDPDFLTFFKESTPLPRLGSLILAHVLPNVRIVTVLKIYVLFLGYLHGHRVVIYFLLGTLQVLACKATTRIRRRILRFFKICILISRSLHHLLIRYKWRCQRQIY